MRISLWRQKEKGARWYRIGVVVVDVAGRLPFKTMISHGDGVLLPIWPRVCWYTMEKHEWDLFDHERRE